MNFGLLALGLALLWLPLAVGPLARTCRPSEWAKLSTAAYLLGATVVSLALVMTALPFVLHLVRLDGVLAICDPAVHHLMIGGPLPALAAIALVGFVAPVVLRAARRSREAARRARIEPWVGTHLDGGDYELVVVPTPAVLAVGVPGHRPQVVISEGLVSRLDRRGVEAVIGHEIAHHRLGHRNLLVAIAAIEAGLCFVPLVRRSAASVRESLEAWADDHAIDTQAIAPAALASALHELTGPDEGCISPERGVAAQDRTSRLADRDRDHQPSATARRLAFAPFLTLSAGAVVLALGWMASSQHLVAFGGYC